MGINDRRPSINVPTPTQCLRLLIQFHAAFGPVFLRTTPYAFAMRTENGHLYFPSLLTNTYRGVVGLGYCGMKTPDAC